jgi:hypothetical protein
MNSSIITFLIPYLLNSSNNITTPVDKIIDTKQDEHIIKNTSVSLLYDDVSPPPPPKLTIRFMYNSLKKIYFPI